MFLFTHEPANCFVVFFFLNRVLLVILLRDIPELTRDEEDAFVLQSKSKRCETPRKSVFADYSFSSRDSSVQEPATWCRASRLPKHSSQLPPSTGQSTHADGVALEDFENTPDV